MIKKIVLGILILVVGIVIGIKLTLSLQSVSGVVHNPAGYDIYRITIFGQDFNYMENTENFQSTND